MISTVCLQASLIVSFDTTNTILAWHVAYG